MGRRCKKTHHRKDPPLAKRLIDRKQKLIHIPADTGFSLLPIDGQNPYAIERVLDVYRQCEDFLALGPQSHASREMGEAGQADGTTSVELRKNILKL